MTRSKWAHDPIILGNDQPFFKGHGDSKCARIFLDSPVLHVLQGAGVDQLIQLLQRGARPHRTSSTRQGVRRERGTARNRPKPRFWVCFLRDVPNKPVVENPKNVHISFGAV